MQYNVLGCGKTSWISKLLKHRDVMFDRPFVKIVFAISEKSNITKEMHTQLLQDVPNIELIRGLPDFDELSHLHGNKLVILDDHILTLINSEEMFNTITIASNHSNISLIITSQNFFLQGKYSKTLHRNTSYKVIFRDRGDRQWLNLYSSQMYGNKSHQLNQAMDWVIEHIPSHFDHYIVVDNSPRSDMPSSMLCKTQIFPNADNEVEPIFLDM
jgi:hypothetical protein